MAEYLIEIVRSAAKELEALEEENRGRVIAAIQRLARDPFPEQSRTMKEAPGVRRIRVGQFRVLYDVEGLTVTVRKVGHRREVYRRLREVLRRG
jgi:mRNA interferase RelE/StbE